MPCTRIAQAVNDGIFHGSPEVVLEDDAVLKRLQAYLSMSPVAFIGTAVLLDMANLLPLFLMHPHKTLCRLNAPERSAFLHGLLHADSFLKRLIGNMICLPFKLAYAGSPEVHASLNIPFYKERIQPEPESRWMKQIFPANTFDGNESIEADVVVVGTGAGGAVVAKELAEKGLAVAIIEEGQFYRRHAFNGNPIEMMSLLYRVMGLTSAIGNCVIPIPMGRAVGGTTLINSATCYRAPDDVLLSWVAHGLADLTPEKMAPYFERVEEHIHVQECEAKYIGPIGEIIRDGCGKMGYSHGPLRHNTLDCDGQAVCVLGCPKDAKQSTNIAYIPKALNSAAQLFTGFRVRDILTEGETAVGIRAYGIGKKDCSVSLTCSAKAVILACGTLITPNVLRRNNLVRGNRWVGRNLTIHPSTYVGAIFPDRELKNANTIPQGYMVDEFFQEGIMFEGATAPFTVLGLTMPGVGKEYTDLLRAYDHLAVFGFMIKDSSTGIVRPGMRDLPLIYYRMNAEDTQKLVKAMFILCDIFRAAGAEKLILPTFNHPVIDTTADLEHAKRKRWRPMDFILSAYHPLGTARMGISRMDSVIDRDHQCHAVPGLFVVDGSSVPTSLGVNPQMTIMALATRAAERIACILEQEGTV